MMRDYGKRRTSQARPKVRSGGGSLGGLIPRRQALGAGLVALALAVLLAGIWVAWLVRGGAQEMSQQRERHQELVRQNQELGEQRNQLLARERIEMEAAKLGLFPPAPGQLRDL
ncbi:hypothetical protein ACHHRT_13310 [Desulfurivibrio sp. D14AmB]|uniref:hypothetical protein n=1 Tax=Desulfurivibrio sp. D14AmB TaxID=3374370 RepID=UPI00376F2761